MSFNRNYIILLNIVRWVHIILIQFKHDIGYECYDYLIKNYCIGIR